MLALAWTQLDFDDKGVARAFGESVVEPIRKFASLTIDIPAVIGGLFTADSAGCWISQSYDKHLFHEKTLRDLPDEEDGVAPRFVFNAPNVQSGAIAIDSADKVRRIVASDPSALSKRMSRNENHQTPLQFAVRMHRPDMVALLMQLGADPLGVDGDGQSASAYATSKNIDRPVMEAIHRMTKAELVSAERGGHPARSSALDLIAALSGHTGVHT